MRRALLTSLVVLASAAPAAADAPSWRLAQPDPPAGAPFKVPLGVPGDLSFWAPNRGLLAVEGNDTVPRGILYYDGVSWRQLMTVCGGPADTTRIVWAGPTEFWTITEPSRPRSGSGRSLCHYANGQIVASYSTADSSPDPYRQMDAGACNGPSDCWFAGVAAPDATGQRVGGFRLHWDGQNLRSVYAPQGRGVTDLVNATGQFWATTAVGARPGSSDPPLLARPEDGPPRLVQLFNGASWVEDPFRIMPTSDYQLDDEAELLSAAASGPTIWIGGGGTASGPHKPSSGSIPHAPVLALRTAGGAFAPVAFDTGAFKLSERFVDIAATGDAVWVAAQSLADSRSPNARARVARVTSSGLTTVTTLPTSGAGRGSAARIAFPSPTEGWMVTSGGWLFHYTDGTPLAPDAEPAFQSLVSFRPNEAAEQFVPDDPPPDDSLINAPVQIDQRPPKKPKPIIKRLKPLLAHVKSRLKGTTLVISFRLRRQAKVGLVARRNGKVVARTRIRKLKPGRYALRLKLNPKRYPTALKFIAREKGSRAPGDGDVVTTR